MMWEIDMLLSALLRCAAACTPFVKCVFFFLIWLAGAFIRTGDTHEKAWGLAIFVKGSSWGCGTCETCKKVPLYFELQRGSTVERQVSKT